MEHGTGPLLDPLLGAADLKAGRLRVLHPGSFRDDPTRLYRAARYAGRFGMRLEPGTAALLREAVAGRWPALLSRDRLRQELMRQLSEKDPGPGMRLMERWGLARFIHPKLRWTGRAAGDPDPVVRLGVCGLAMGKAGIEMIRSLPIAREQSQAILTALELTRSPRTPLPKGSLEMLRLHHKGLAPTAFSPLLIDGEDLKRSGLPPGKEYREWLDTAARAQWRGEFRTRSEALRWLRGVLGPRAAYYRRR
jgi:tRNA nucleotidyltransferase/poly(A) polymerase